MGKNKKWLILFLAVDALAVAAFFGYRALRPKGGDPRDGYAWVTMDEAYVPKNDVETFIKKDAENRGAFPVHIRSYGSEAKILGMFKGKRYAKPGVKTLEMLNQGLDGWMIVDIRYQSENEREVIRTVLYLLVKGVWVVGDTGTLIAS